LWFGPLVILLLGGIGIFIFLRRQNPRIIATTDPGLTAAEEKRVEALLREES
jgi:cytochrome c-type biogenesis protein CcmH